MYILGSKILKIEHEKWKKARTVWTSSLSIGYLKTSVYIVNMDI